MNARNRDKGASAQAGSRRHLTGALLLALGAVAIILGLYEVAERTWLDGADVRVIHTLQMVRTIVSCVVLAALVGWLIVRQSPPLLATMPSEEERVRGARPTERDRMVNYAHWFILMRWIAVVVAATLVFICIWVARLLPTEVALPLMLTVVVLAGSNVLHTVLLRRGHRVQLLLKLQIYGDLTILTVLLHFSGGIENPLAPVMLLHVIIGGIILSRRQCYAVAAIGSVLVALLAFAEWAHLLEHYTLLIFPHFRDAEGLQHAAHYPLYIVHPVGLHAAILFLTAYFVTTLADRLRHNERQLETMADHALAERQLLERSLETTGTAVRVVERGLRSRWTNARWEAWFGGGATGSSAAKQLDGERSASRKTFRDGRTRIRELTLNEQRHGRPDPFEPAPARRVFQVMTAPLRDAAGRVTQVVELAQDVTEQKRHQAQLIRAGQLAAVGELAGQVAHEVNNPIAIISAKTRLLLSGQRAEMSDETAGELAKIRDLSDRVAGIARGLLSSSRPSGAVRLALDIRMPIRRALAMVEQRARDTGVKIEDSLPDGLPNVRANAQEMEQLFLNLFLNALDAMQGGGRLIVDARPDQRTSGDGDQGVAITVRDTGCGIPEAMRERVFRPFFTTKTQGRGTGLGLSICQGLVRSHGGRLDVESQVGEGTRFTILLPVGTEGHAAEPHHA
jgi:signal transduction histidine kinase